LDCGRARTLFADLAAVQRGEGRGGRSRACASAANPALGVHMSGRIWALLIAIALGTAVLVHLATLAWVPQFVMTRTVAQMGTVNTMHHAPRPTALSRGVVRPSPD